jgi:hypothetical protein
MSKATTLYLVISTISGYTREDAPEAHACGVYTDEKVAKAVARVTHSKVVPLELDKIAPGHLEAFKAFGIKLEGITDVQGS